MIGEKPESFASWIAVPVVRQGIMCRARRLARTVLPDRRAATNDEDGLPSVFPAPARCPRCSQAEAAVGWLIQANGRGRESDGNRSRLIESQVVGDLAGP